MDLTVPVVVIKGFKRSGKSTFAHMLRQAAHAGDDADLEYSDAMIKVVNLAWVWFRIRSTPDTFFRLVIRASEEVLKRPLPQLPNEWFTQTEERRQVHRALTKWVSRVSRLPDHVITRETKDEHRDPLIWVGYFVRLMTEPEVWGVDMRRRLEGCPPQPLITAAGARSLPDVQPLLDLNIWILEVRRGSEADADPTNRYADHLKPHGVVRNTGTPLQLERIARNVWYDIGAGCVRGEYFPS